MMFDLILKSVDPQTDLTQEDVDVLKTAYEKDRTGYIDQMTETRIVSETQVLDGLSRLYKIPFFESLMFDNTIDTWVRDISIHFLKNNRLVPLMRENEQTILAIHDPSNLSIIDDICRVLNITDYMVVLAKHKEIIFAINTFYDRSGENTQKLVQDIEGNEFTIIDDSEETTDLLDDTSDAPVIRLVNHMISQAVKAGASDIHIEPFQEILQVRYRIDGILYEMLTPPKGIQSSLVSRIKVMAKMNIAEKRVPQDGRAQVRIGNQEIDIRISTVPTAYGERLVMRLLNKSGYFLAFSEFGLSNSNYDLIQQVIRQTHGIVLVTGPTGSGKTTSLYAALSDSNSPDKNIITIEDPIEYNLKGIGQIQVNEKTGVTFAKGLRSIVRQDPDIVLIGEIRDLETAEIAIQSALTGHLVFSTLHTNDSASAITRLVDLGLEPYLISSSVNTIIAQRLVRRLCSQCKEPFELNPSHVASLNGVASDRIGETIYKPNGCPECFNTGYAGREAIFEILCMDDALKSLILKTSDANQIKAQALKSGLITLRRDGMDKVLQGITSIGELLRVTQE